MSAIENGTRVFIVMASEGDWSDRVERLMAVVTTPTEAEEIALRLDRRYNERKAWDSELWRRHGEDPEQWNSGTQQARDKYERIVASMPTPKPERGWGERFWVVDAIVGTVYLHGRDKYGDNEADEDDE